MRERTEAMHSSKVATRTLSRCLTGRMGLLASTLGVLVFFGSVQTGTAASLSVTPNKGCPGETVTFKGSGFGLSQERGGARDQDEEKGSSVQAHSRCWHSIASKAMNFEWV